MHRKKSYLDVQRRHKCRNLAILASACALFSQAAEAQPWDAAAGYGAAPWSYHQRSGAGCTTVGGTISGPYAAMPAGLSVKAGGPSPTYIPIVGKNTTSQAITTNSVTVPANSFWMHPGMNGVCAVVRFTAPNDGHYTFNGKMTSIDNAGPNSVRGYFFGPSNGTPNQPLSPAIALTSGPTGTTVTLPTVTVDLSAGDWVDFALDSGTNNDPLGNYRFDSTGVALSVQYRANPPRPMSGDHYQCYSIEKSSALKPETIAIIDQFGRSQAVLGRPVQLCNPAVKIHGDRKFNVENRERHLVCYQIVKPANAPMKRRVTINNQFAPTTFDVVRQSVFCVPSSKKLIGAKEHPLD